MRMTSEDRKRFSSQLDSLADEFNNTTAQWIKQAKAADGENWLFTGEQQKANARRVDKVDSLIEEFRALGYSDKQWNQLLKTSGVEAKMEQAGPYGGSYSIQSVKVMNAFIKRFGAGSAP